MGLAPTGKASTPHELQAFDTFVVFRIAELTWPPGDAATRSIAVVKSLSRTKSSALAAWPQIKRCTIARTTRAAEPAGPIAKAD